MATRRTDWAWLCSASLWWGATAFAAEPQRLTQKSETTTETTAREPDRHEAEPQASQLGVRAMSPDEFWSRLERAESRIAELETRNQSLLEAQQQPIQNANGLPFHMAPFFGAQDPEIGIAREQSWLPVVYEAPRDGAKAEAPKPKKWYDKISFRGYAQFRINEETHSEDGSAPAHYVGDRSLADNQNFLIRRARVIFSGDVHEHVYVYLQSDFASSGTDPNNHFAQMRDWYADVYLDAEKEHRFRVGQSKVPYGWENIQSSSNRVPLDRNDAFNSGVRNERDLGVFYYYTPTWAQGFFKDVLEKGYKGTGNYGLFGVGLYNGQGGSLIEVNDDVHVVARLTVPYTFENCQHMEVGIQGYTGEYAVTGSTISPLGVGTVTPEGTVATSGAGVGANAADDRDGWNDERLGASFIWYPQPFGFQTEWTIGRGPALNAAQTALEERALYGGYAMLLYKIDECYGTWFPFVRYSYFKGGYKSERNAPFVDINEWELGTEWQINSAAELTLAYLFTDRTNTTANGTAGTSSYGQFDGQAVRLQFQVNY